MSVTRHRHEYGFTLIELLVVIVILGVVAAIVVFAVGGITDKSKSSACKTDLKHVEVAEEAYFSQNNVYVSVATLVAPPAPAKPLLREAPSSPYYAISVNTATGDVTSSPACSSL